MRPLVGIDIGWSEKRASCGLAVMGDALPLPAKAVDYGGGVRAVALRHRDLIAWLRERRGELSNGVIVIDGPLCAAGVPASNRMVDVACGSGQFRGRCQPYPIEGAISKPFRDATREVLSALGNPPVWLGGDLPESLVVAETNPTVALALMMPRIAVSRLTSRGRALQFEGRRVTAKSDWYWRHGAGKQAAHALGASVSGESDHERCAALLCLAVASLLVRGRVLALGDTRGVYVVPAELDASWQQALRGLIHHGTPLCRDYTSQCSTYWRDQPVPELFEERAMPSVTAAVDRAELILVLSDSGGVWTKHNSWLNGLRPPVFLRSLDVPQCPTLVLQHAERDASGAHWTVEPTVRKLASLHGYDGSLSLVNSVKVRVMLIDRLEF